MPIEDNTNPGTLIAEPQPDFSLVDVLIPTAWLLALLVICFAPTLRHLVQDWIKNEDMGHGFFVPVVAAYIAWLKRGDLVFPAKVNKWGIAIVGLAALQQYVATLGAEL